MSTIRDVVTRSLKLIEEVGAGETASSESAFDGLNSLITMIDSWSIQNQLVFTETRESFSLTSGDGDYSIGSGANFNTTRPIEIIAAFIRIDGTDYSLELIGAGQYSEIPDKSAQAMPNVMYFDGNYPNANILLHPVPNQSMTLHIYSKKPLSNFTSLDDTLSAPVGYERAFIYNLAIEIAPEYGKQASPSVIQIAGESKIAIESANSINDNVVLNVDAGLVSIGKPTGSIYEV